MPAAPGSSGLAETQQALVANGLRHKVRLQVDGGLKTGLDIVKAAILGAESFGFGTGPLIALGCKFLRICHLNNCATGVATQDETLRKEYFAGVPEMVMNYFRFMVQETRNAHGRTGHCQPDRPYRPNRSAGGIARALPPNSKNWCSVRF